MNQFILEEAISCLDFDLLEHHLKIKMAKNCGKTDRKVRLKWIKPMLVAGLIMFIFVIGILASSLAYPQIDLINSSEKTSVRYVPKWIVKETDSLVPYYTEQELFEQADYIFSGTIDEIKQIEINFDGKKVYKSLISITVNEKFKGDCQDKIQIMAAAIGVYESTNNKLLYELNEGAYGVFMATKVTQDEIMMENECQFNASEICDAQFEDGFRFGFIKDEKTNLGICCDTIAQRSDKTDNVFTSLENYKWPDIIAYILKSLNE